MAFEIGYRPPELLVPLVQHMPGIGMVPTSLGRDMLGRADGHEQIAAVTHAMGRGAKPSRSILLNDPSTGQATIVLGDGQTEMAELEDLAHEVLERNEERRKRTGSSFDWAGARERAGLPRREEMANRWKEAIEERIRQHKANPVTDPVRKPWMPKGNPKVFFGDAHYEPR